MRFLLTTHQCFPDFESGTEVLTLSVARELRARGHDVAILTGYPNDIALADDRRFDEYDFDGFHVHRFHHAYVPMGGQTSKLEIDYDNKLANGYFKGLLGRFDPDIVHFFHLNRLGTGADSRCNRGRSACLLYPDGLLVRVCHRTAHA